MGVQMAAWQRWLQHPEHFWVHKALFQIHLWLGAGVGLYVVVMSLTGSVIVYRNELSRWFSVEWIVNLHENLLAGQAGRLVNGIGALCVTAVCLTGAIIWWPGITNWRRSVTVNWGARFPRFSWDLHSALGFWFFFFILMWGISGIYFSLPQAFSAVSSFLDPGDKWSDQALYWLSQAHFGRFNWFSQALWSLFGLIPAALAFTGIFLCCHRMIYHRSANPNRH
jgi:uncharacterized iron-regulated membrane protein